MTKKSVRLGLWLIASIIPLASTWYLALSDALIDPNNEFSGLGAGAFVALYTPLVAVIFIPIGALLVPCKIGSSRWWQGSLLSALLCIAAPISFFGYAVYETSLAERRMPVFNACRPKCAQGDCHCLKDCMENEGLSYSCGPK